jgi:hypothetical protein
MPDDPASQMSHSSTDADFTYSMMTNEIEITDTGRGKKTVEEDIVSVLRAIEEFHQGKISGFRIMLKDAAGDVQEVSWDGERVGFV